MYLRLYTRWVTPCTPDDTRRTQPFTYGDHSIFTAEVASTVNESLLMHHLLDKETNETMRRYLINYYIEEIPYHPVPPDDVRGI